MENTTVYREVSFGAPWGRALRVLSGVSVIFFVGATWIVLRTLTLSAPMKVAVVVVPVVILLGAAAFMILGYELRDDALFIKRPGWTTRIPLAGLRTGEIDRVAVTRAIRLFGNGGLFGFSGLFWSKSLGRFRAFVTDLDRAVVLKFADRTIVVSPDSPENFVAALRGRSVLAERCGREHL